MFEYRKIKHFRVKQGLLGQELWIKYEGSEEKFLTCGKVNVSEFKKKQGVYLRAAYKKVRESAKSWKKRHQNYLHFRGLTTPSN